MEQNPHAPSFDALPEKLPIFPLSKVLLLPNGNLPLNIFEKRYLKMVEDALGGNRLIGIIQTKDDDVNIYNIGCAGKITEFKETPDGRYLITLNGINRFHVAEELQVNTPYRQVRADWSSYKNDFDVPDDLGLDRKKLTGLLQSYFTAQKMECDWDAVKKAHEARLITCLAMICPFDAKEKQALLEAPCGRSRTQAFMTMLEMAVKDRKECKSCH